MPTATDVSKQVDKLLKELKKSIMAHPKIQHVNPASLSIRVKLQFGPAQQGVAHALAQGGGDDDGCLHCTPAGCVKVDC